MLGAFATHGFRLDKWRIVPIDARVGKRRHLCALQARLLVAHQVEYRPAYGQRQ